MGTRRRWMLALPLLTAVAQTPAQQEMSLRAVPYQPKPATTIRAETNLVDIGVVVRDNRAHSIAGLTKSDFAVRDDGKPREIASFAVEKFTPAAPAAKSAPATGSPTAVPPPAPGLPRWVGIVFDDIASTSPDLFNAETAAKRFLKDGLAANDRVGIFTTSTGLILPFTRDVTKLSEAIDSVKFRDHQARSASCPLMTEFDSYRIANNLDPEGLAYKAQEYNNCAHVCMGGGGGGKKGASFPTSCDSATSYVQGLAKSLWAEIRMNSQDTYKALEDIVTFVSQMQGTRVLLLASSGFFAGTLEAEEDRVTTKALRANVVINSLDAKGLYTPDFNVGQGATPRGMVRQLQSGLDGKAQSSDAMENLADATGGLFFHNNNDLDLGFHELGMEPEVSYMLGVAPEALDGKFHKLKVSLTDGKKYLVEARKGYLANAPKPVEEPPQQRRMDTEVFTTSSLSEAPVTVSARPEKGPDGHQMACVTFRVDVAKTQFVETAGKHAQNYRMIAAVFDLNGAYVAGIEGLLQFAMQDATYQKFVKTGMTADVHLDVPAGAYRLRTVVVEGDNKGRYSTATQPVEFK